MQLNGQQGDTQPCAESSAHRPPLKELLNSCEAGNYSNGVTRQPVFSWFTNVYFTSATNLTFAGTYDKGVRCAEGVKQLFKLTGC